MTGSYKQILLPIKAQLEVPDSPPPFPIAVVVDYEKQIYDPSTNKAIVANSKKYLSMKFF